MGWHRVRSRRALGAVVVAAVLAVALPACGVEDEPAYALADCTPDNRDGRSVARIWDETLLQLIREVIPAPTVHARNLFHTSAAMWDAWAAYDPTAAGYFVDEQLTADDVLAAREAAISFAAYRLLVWRYGTVSDLPTAVERLDAVMASLCYDPAFVATDGDSPAALGNRIAEAVIEAGADDGALENERYVDSSYRPANPPLIVDEPGTEMDDPNAWQPLSLGEQIAQNGLPIPGKIQAVIGPHWGSVTSFALPPSPTGTPIDLGPPPRLGDPDTDEELKQSVVEVLRYSSQLDPTDGEQVDASPGAIGDNSLGTNDGDGREQNPATGEPYEPNVVARADFRRVVAEYWADGPESETPPGHWNVIANKVQDAPGFARRIGGTGPILDPLEWDVKVYFALNGAVHDAAIAAWGLKGYYDSVRPISLVRYMGGRGQSSDPTGPAYDRDGLPLEPDLIEVVTDESSRPGERHADLAEHVGEVAVRAWRGFPDDPENETSGVGWIRAVEWVPYQMAGFVTPAFAGYVSGHSTFSRAAAEIMSAITGSEYFPGGEFTWAKQQGDLLHEEGPTEDVTIGWATYYDAADQAGISRLYMGIHIAADDVDGRRIGAEVGRTAWARAQQFFDGTAAG
jgi:hypothetical protein